MFADVQLRGKLKGFLERLLPGELPSLSHDFGWPNEFLELRASFGHLVWGRLVAPSNSGLFGIRRVMGEAFSPVQRAVSAHDRDRMELYMAVEVLDVATARVYLSPHNPPNEWYVLEERRVQRDFDSSHRPVSSQTFTPG